MLPPVSPAEFSQGFSQAIFRSVAIAEEMHNDAGDVGSLAASVLDAAGTAMTIQNARQHGGLLWAIHARRQHDPHLPERTCDDPRADV